MDREAREKVIWQLAYRQGDTGKTKLVKLLFLLQEVEGLPLGYRFRMHHYGPYAFEVQDDLASLESEGKIRVASDPSGYGYHVTSMQNPEALPDSDDKLANLLARYGGLSVNDLEILTTVIFVNRITGTSGNELCSRVSTIKPRYSKDFIAEKVRQAEVDSLLSTS